MFGSKQLLIAFLLGVLGLSLATGALATTLEGPQLILLMIGLGMIWISGLFGPLFFMQEKGITRIAQDSQQEDSEKPDA